MKRKRRMRRQRNLKTLYNDFSANASKSKQATSRQKMLENLKIDDLPLTTRKYPYVNFKPTREAGKDLLYVDGISKTIDGVKLLDNVSFSINKGDKVAFLGSDLAKSTLYSILMGEMEPDTGKYTWGVTITKSYFPHDNSSYFQDKELDIINWLRQFSENKEETFIRGFLGKCFSLEKSLKRK